MLKLFRKKIETEKVFGVSNQIILSYLERKKVDEKFKKSIEQDKSIIIYGSSKQGKTSLIQKHLEESKYLKIECTPGTKLTDIYLAIIRQSNIEIVTGTTKEIASGTDGKIGLKATIKIPMIFDGEAAGEISEKSEEKSSSNYKTIDYNLSLPQSIIEILKANKIKKYIVLENFHYLPESEQRAFSFDLRTYQDNNIIFIILGIWRERNRLSQYNGDLQDRMIEIPVEPWERDEFINVLKKGENILNVSFEKIQDKIIEASFDSIGVLQELAKQTCYSAGVNNGVRKKIEFNDDNLNEAINIKLSDYSTRHNKSFEAFIDNTYGSAKDTIYDLKTIDEKRKYPLYIPNYFIKILLESKFDEIIDGFERTAIQDRIKKIHYRPDDVRPSDMSNFLHNIIASQIQKQISPPLFDYDGGAKKLKIIDSTLYFYLKHSEKKSIINDLDL